MPKPRLSRDQIEAITYATLRDGLRLMPDTPEDERANFPLAGLHYANLQNDPDFPRKTTAKVLVKAFSALGYSITSPLGVLQNSDAKMSDLWDFIDANNIPRFDDDVSDGSNG